MARHRSLFVILTLLFVLPLAEPSAAQTTGAGAPNSGIGLTADHKRVIYREVGREPARNIPEGSPVAIGVEVPDSLMLNEMPVSVKDQIGLLRDFKFAKLPDETIVIVDPAQRRIVDMVTKADGTR